MKVLLINPPSFNTISSEVPSIVCEERGHNPPLGIMYLASYLEKHTDHAVEVIDTQVEEMSYAQLEKEIGKRKPDIVGISVMTFTIMDCIITARIVKEIDRGIKIIFGGPHVNIFPEETIKMKEVDFIVLGEGEMPFCELVNVLDKGLEVGEVKGIVFRNGEKVINTGKRPLIENLDSIPFPARYLVPYKKYSSLLAKRSPITTLITSRGCPYKCAFCDRPHLGKIFRARSAEKVVDEIEECINLGIYEFLIYDDTFTINRKRVINICREILKRGLKIGWDIRARVNTVDKELLKLLKKAGCERIHYGVESGNQEILNTLRKGITLQQVRTAFKLTKESKIDTLAYFMLGNPGDTKETIEQTINFAKKINPDFVHFTILVPFPATDVYSWGLHRGIIKKDYWKEFAENPSKDFLPPIWEEHLSRKELIQMLIYAYKSFYTRPTYIVKKSFKIRSLEEFFRKLKAGLKIFKL